MSADSIVVVGAGPAGVAAAIQCRRLGVAPRCIDRAGRAGGLAENARRIENYPGLRDPVGGVDFAAILGSNLERWGLAVEAFDVVRVQREDSRFRLDGISGSLHARAVILASGTEPARIDIPGARALEGERVFYDIRSLLRRHPTPRRVMVIGGGEAACDYALSLAAAGASVAMIVRSAALKARGELAAAVMSERRIDIRFSARCEAVAGRRSFAVRLAETAAPDEAERLADALLIAAGRRSAATRMLGAAEPELGRSIAAPCGVFVAGDARTGSLGQIGTAVGDGLRAAADAVAYLEEA